MNVSMEIGRNASTNQPLFQSAEDRRRHTYVIGQTGSGKSTLLFNMAVQDIQQGRGLAFFDPHGQEAEKLLDYIPPERVGDVIYFSPKDFIIPFNPLDKHQKTRTLQTVDSVFHSLWPTTYGESANRYTFLNMLRTALFLPDPSFLTVRQLLQDGYHGGIQDEAVREFWEEWETFPPRDRVAYAWSTRNKLGQFLMDPRMRAILCQKTKIKAKTIMDKHQIFIANLSKGAIGHLNMRILGSLLVAEFLRYALARAQPEDFYLYLDEFQNFATETFETILSEARKYRLNLILAHQYLDQLDRDLQSAIFANAGTWLSFR
jgi:type IV secretory pathway TraG/TraD family ATPase VirD4